MNLIDRIIWRLGKKSRTFQRGYMWAFGAPRWSGRAVADMVREGYERNPFVYSAINAISRAAAVAPPVLYRIKGGGQIERALENGYRSKGLYRPQTKQQAAQQAAGNLASHYARTLGVNPRLAKRAAMKQLQVDGEIEEVTAHPVLDVLARPNGYYQTSYQQLVEAFVTYLMISGEVYEEPVGPDTGANAGVPREIYVLPSQHFAPMAPVRGNPLPGFYYEGGPRQTFTYDPDPAKTEIYFHKLFNPSNPIRGMSPMEAAMRSVDLNNESRAWNAGLMQNGGAPVGILTADGETTLGQEDIDLIKTQYAEQHAGARNAGLPMVMGGLKYQHIGYDPAKMMWGDTLTLSAREIAVVFGVPPEMLGDSATKTYSNYASARKALYMDTALPITDFMYGAWNSGWLKRFGDDLLLDYAGDQIDALQEDVAQMYARLERASFLTENEKRVAAGWPAVEGGDVILVPVGRVPLAATEDAWTEVDEKAALAEYSRA